jgi:hypothetical protein
VNPHEAQLANQLFGQGQPAQSQQPSIGAIEAAVEGIKAVAPGLSWDKIVGDVGHMVKQEVAAGAHELAAALFNGSAFVMYPRGTREDHGVHGPQQAQAQGQEAPQQAQTQGVEAPTQQQERGGREM